MSSKNTLKISKEVAQYLVLNDLASKWIVSEDDVEVALRVLKRNSSSYTLSNGDKVGYTNRNWFIIRK